MDTGTQRKTSPAEYLIFAASLVLVAGLFIYLATRLDIDDSRLAFDWKIFWRSMENGHMRWDLNMFNPPWGVIFLLPLEFLSLKVSWGLLIFFTFTVLVFSVPTQYGRTRHLAGILLLTLSYSSLRNFIDANLEAITIAAVLVLIYAYQKRWVLPFILAAPYSNGHSVLVVLAFGIIPLALEQPRLGVPLFALFQVPYLFLLSEEYIPINTYWTLVLLVCWVVFAVLTYRQESSTVHPITGHTPQPNAT